MKGIYYLLIRYLYCKHVQSLDLELDLFSCAALLLFSLLIYSFYSTGSSGACSVDDLDGRGRWRMAVRRVE